MIAALYLNHNAKLPDAAEARTADHLLNVNGQFFMVLMGFQGSLAFLMTAFIGPGLICARPRQQRAAALLLPAAFATEYVLGRGVRAPLSAVVHHLGARAASCSASKAASRARLGLRTHCAPRRGIFVGSMLWIAVLTLLALALSAWVRWRIVAGATAARRHVRHHRLRRSHRTAIMRTDTGFYLDPAALVAVIYANFFGVEIDTGISTLGAALHRTASPSAPSVSGCCRKKIRAFEVVR